MVEIRLTGLSRVHADGTRALSDLDLHIRGGEFFVLAGPSGCGKTTTLRIIAGLEAPTAGTVSMDGQPVDGVPAHARDVALVTQEDSVYPHLDVHGNLSFGLRARRLPPAEVEQRVQAESRALGIRRLLRRRPDTLAAGERQKTALGRATARLPRVFLLDEPLGRMEPAERARIRAELGRIHRGLGITTVYVTHDQGEAMALGDRVAVLDQGVLQQVGPPLELYRRPRNAFVAGFLGDPPMAVLPAVVHVGPRHTWLGLGDQRLRLPPDQRLLLTSARRVLAGLRAEDLVAVEPSTAPADAVIRMTVRHVERRADRTHATGPVSGMPAPAIASPGGPGLVTARLDPSRPVARGDELALRVNLSGLRYFDPSSGLSMEVGTA